MTREKVCFRLKVKVDRREEDIARHAEVCQDMLLALSEMGWENYSLFLDEDGLLIGYFETEDLDAALAGMDSREVNARWQKEMAEFFEGLGAATPDRGFHRLIEVFNLQNQMAKLSSMGKES